uniref:Uncharacterized protein n=1 Tax=Macrostomum lignano TaxID=282301 RepID=A0A1I8FBR3_9PLAT
MSAAQQVAAAADCRICRCPVADSDRKISPGAKGDAESSCTRTPASSSACCTLGWCALDAGSYASNPAGSITLPTLIITGTSRPHRRSGSICRFCGRRPGLGKPVTGRAYLGARHQLHTDLATVGVKLATKDLMQWFAASQV